MMPLKSAHDPVERYRLSTEEFAAQHLVQPQTVRKQYAAVGAYCGIKPLRLPNRRLLWPADTIARLAAEMSCSGDQA